MTYSVEILKSGLEATKHFFEKAVPSPKEKNIHTQMGCHFEEVREMLDCITALSPEAIRVINQASNALEELANYLKTNNYAVVVHPHDRAQYLDALCDQIVTAVGCAHMDEMDIVGGMEEVNRSNLSKFDDNGEPIFNENMKVMKGPNYSPADFKQFV